MGRTVLGDGLRSRRHKKNKYYVEYQKFVLSDLQIPFTSTYTMNTELIQETIFRKAFVSFV